MPPMLRTIYDTLAEQPVNVGGQTARVYNIHQLANVLDGYKLPARLLLPLGTPTEGQGFAFVTLGTTTQVIWQVVDLFLYKSVTRGTGLAEFAEALVDYCQNYALMLKKIRSFGGQTYLEQADIRPGSFNWPVGSDKYYVGVECILQIGDINSDA